MRYWKSCFVIWVIFILGCSGSSPVVPNVSSDPDVLKSHELNSNRVLWGLWHVNIDPDSMTAGLTPLRSAEFTANVTKFMQPPIGPVHMLEISVLPGSEPSTGYFEVDITITHPFPGLNHFNGFDVRGILYSDGTQAGEHDPTAVIAGADETHMVNPDGWTRWWNAVEFTSYDTIFGFTQGALAPPNFPSATVNPYKYFADSLDSTAPATSIESAGRGFFTSGSSNTRTYQIQFATSGGSPIFDFQYAIDASWEPPDPAYEPDYPQEAFSSGANMAEAWAVSVADAGSTAYFVDPTDNGNELVLDIEVFDWQATENPSGVPGEVSGIWVEGPVINGVYDVLSNATVLPGSTSVSSVFEVTIDNLNLTKSGSENLFLTVESADPSGYQPQISGGDNYDYPDSVLASYFSAEVTILDSAPADPASVEILCPMWGFPDDYLTDILLEGSNIADGTVVEIEDELGIIIPGLNVYYIDDTSLEFDIDLTGAAIGYYTVIVTNPGAPGGEQENGFEVMDPDNLPTWYAVQGDRAHTGMVGLYGPCDVQDAPTWTHNWQPNPYGNPLPVYLNEDTCFISNTGDGGPLPCGAVDIIGHTTLWSQQFHDDMQNWLNVKCITEDGSVVLTYESGYFRLVGLDGTDGSFMWQVAGVETRVDSFPTLDLDGNFIVPIKDVGYYSIDPSDGTINWNSNTGDMYYSQPAVGGNGRIYAYDGDQNNGRLMALDPSDGSVIWYSEGLGNCRANGVTVHPNGTLIIPRIDGLTCIEDNDTSATILWTEPYECPFYSSVAIAPDGTIIFVEWSGTIHRIDQNTGESLDSAALPPGTAPSNRPAISKDGHIYLRTRNYSGNLTFFACYDKDLTLKWQWYHGLWIGGTGMPCAPALGQDGTLYSSSRIYGIMAWKDD